jgi:hypothetical protein
MSRTQLEIFYKLAAERFEPHLDLPKYVVYFTDNILFKNNAVLEKLAKAAAGRGVGGGLDGEGRD